MTRVERTLAADAAAAFRFRRSSDFRKGASIGRDGFRNGLVIDKLPFTAAGDEIRLAENLEMVRDSGGGDAAHRDDVATAYSVGC